jgi:hypothetical protein
MGALFGIAGEIARSAGELGLRRMVGRLGHRGAQAYLPTEFTNTVLCGALGKQLATPVLSSTGLRFLFDVTPGDLDLGDAVRAFAAGGVQALEDAIPNCDWAFAAWDVERQRLLLGRDRFGAKPLSYSVLPNAKGIVFASEYKALLVHDEVQATIDPEMVWILQQDKHLPPTRTLLSEVKNVSPGEVLEFDLRGSIIAHHTWFEVSAELESR